jgi:hypothetical protein
MATGVPQICRDLTLYVRCMFWYNWYGDIHKWRRQLSELLSHCGITVCSYCLFVLSQKLFA